MRDAAGRMSDVNQHANCPVTGRRLRADENGAVYALSAHCRVPSSVPGRFLPAGVVRAILDGRSTIRARRS
ncbi:MAG: hypothetical protein IT562_21555 [Alphaproteobacteria bacterium]|nr:hypothetical protein [Alphaproteobacteria bacterium]